MTHIWNWFRSRNGGVTHQRGVSCDVQVLGTKSYQDFSSGLHKYQSSKARDGCERNSFDRDAKVLIVLVRHGGQPSSTRCLDEDVIELVLHRKSSLPIQAR